MRACSKLQVLYNDSALTKIALTKFLSTDKTSWAESNAKDQLPINRWHLALVARANWKIKDAGLWVLCILNSKPVLGMQFADWNNHFQGFNMFSHLFPSQTEKEEKCAKIKGKNTQSDLLSFSVCDRKNRKLVKTPIKMISTSKQRVEHPFTGWNTQQKEQSKWSKLIFVCLVDGC